MILTVPKTKRTELYGEVGEGQRQIAKIFRNTTGLHCIILEALEPRPVPLNTLDARVDIHLGRTRNFEVGRKSFTRQNITTLLRQVV